MEAGSVGADQNLTISNSTVPNLVRSECVIGARSSVTVLLAGGVGIVILSLVGIIGNILALIVLTRPRMRTSPTSVILSFLAVCDLTVVILYLLVEGCRNVFGYFCVWPFYEHVILVVTKSYSHGLLSTALVGSIYFTVGVSVERLVVVYRPLLARSACSAQNVLRASVTLAALVIIYTLSYWLIYTYEVVNDTHDEPTYVKKSTQLRLEFVGFFDFYVIWLDLFVAGVIPFTVLIVVNVLIYNKIRDANRLRTAMTQGQGSDANEISITKMLLCIVVIFVVCNSPWIYIDVVNGFYKDFILRGSGTHSMVGLLFTLNSSVNIFVYCFVGRKFRLTFLQIFWKRPSRSPTHSSRRSTSNDETLSRSADTSTSTLSVRKEVIPMQ